MTPRIEYLGHAGFIVSFAGKRLLIDPWFYPAFLGSWFPLPDNRDRLPRVVEGTFDYLYISHTHEDHFDVRLLEQLDRGIEILVPKYRSGALARRFKSLGFENLRLVAHQETVELAPGFSLTMILDTSHKEDSGVLLDMGGFRFLDLNDCNPRMTELPMGIDVLAAQYSGAMWYPNCYDYPPAVMQEKVDVVRKGLIETLAKKIALTQARSYLPSAGPACFLDPSLASYNDRVTTIFPQWEDVRAEFEAHGHDVRVLRTFPGDELIVRSRDEFVVEGHHGETEPDLDAYRERRRTEWEAYYTLPEDPVTLDELKAYFENLQRTNRHLLKDYSKFIRLVSDGHAAGVNIGRLAEYFEIEGEEPYDPEYTLLVSNRLLRQIIEGATGWEEALLSMRVGLHRDPDVFDLKLMSLLRYGNEPAQTMHIVREQRNKQMIERDGFRMQRYCPHAGEDLSMATICNGVIECPRHHWKWDVTTGKCIEGGTIPLAIEALQSNLSKAE